MAVFLNITLTTGWAWGELIKITGTTYSPYVLLQPLWFTMGSGSGTMPGDPWPSPSNRFLLMSLQSRELNQEIEEFLYVSQFQGKMHQEVKFSEKTHTKKQLTLEGVRMAWAVKMCIPAASVEILVLPVGLRHWTFIKLWLILMQLDTTK